MRLTQPRQRLRDLGAAPCHEGRVLRAWVQGRSLDTKRRRAEDFLPLAVREELPSLFGELELIGVSPHFLSDFLIPIKDNQLTPAALSQTLQ
jgi:hypothetical protein